MSVNFHPFTRYKGNPIIDCNDIPYSANTVFNAAACKFEGKYILLLRIEDLSGYSHFTLAHSEDGYNFIVDDKPWLTPSQDPEYEIYERFGVEDPRITKIGDRFYITYTAFGPHGPRVGIGYTKNFKSFKRISLATEVENKDAVLFPEKINGHYVMIDRPGGNGGNASTIWITYSTDLVFWGKAKALLSSEPGWSASKLGVSTPPIKTEEGWLVLYHGVRQTASGRLYRVGAMLLDLENPEKILGNTLHFILGPEEFYERVGDVPNVIFPCGIILEEDQTVKLYYGAADTCIALAEASLSDLIALCKVDETLLR